MGSVDLDLRGTPGGTDLDLGGSSGDDRTAIIAATTAAPRSALSAVRGPLAAVAVRTSAPSAAVRILSGRVAVIAARTDAPRAALAGIVRSVLTGTVQARTAAPRSVAAGAFDWNMLTQDVAPSRLNWLRGGGGLQAKAAICYRDAPQAGRAAASPWIDGDPAGGAGADAWRDAAWAAGDSIPRWRDGRLEATAGPAEWRDSDRASQGSRDQWRDARREDHDRPGNWMSPYHVGTQQRLIWRTQPPLETLSIVADLGDASPAAAPLRACWRDAGLVLYVVRPPPGPPPPPPWEHWGNNLCLVQPLGLPLDLGWYGCRDWTGWRIPRRRSYIVVHDIEVVRLPDRYPIAVASLTISLDADAWAWSWSGTLLGAEALEAVLPVDDAPVTLEASIDGYLWHLLVEEWSEDRAFGSRAIRATGRGLTAWLAAPYQLPGSGISALDRTVQQLLEAHLPAGEGWSLTWEADVPDWLVPGGAWSWAQKAPISAIHEAAQGVGLMVVPSRTLRVLHIQPRYRVLPWDYGSADPDLVIPDSAILQLTRQRQAQAQANGVYVHGGEVGGILARVYRAGTDGARLANTEMSPLITHVDGARLLGSRILAAHEAQPEVRSISLPLGGVFPLQELGDLLELEIGTDLVRGTVSGIEVQVATAGAGQSVTVRQTLTLGEETPNQWAKFARLLPGDPLLVGEATTLHADGTVTVTLIGGGTVRVRGEAAEGQMVYIRGGRIEGEAPQLSGYEIDV